MNNKVAQTAQINKTGRIKITSFLCAVILLLVFFMTSAYAGLVSSQNDSNSASIPAGSSISTPLYEITPPLSKAVNIIRTNFELKKSALLNSDITFKAEEFEKILGIKKLKYITITSLPNVKEGVLTLGGSDILEGQTISRENIQYIRLVPYPDKLGTIKFYFKNTDDTTQDASIPCIVSVLDSLNFAPSANPVTVSTQKNIPVFKAMNGTDPDEDNVTYKIIQAPKKGLLEIKNTSNGSFIYRPSANYSGSDKFIYQVEDEYGNLSNPATVQIKVTKPASDVMFSDLTDHWAYNSAVKAVGYGFIDINKNDSQNIDLKFDPSYLMTRAEFVEMVMRAAKLDKNITEVYKTDFADDSDIQIKYKPYVEKAYELGIISGISIETGLYFDPNSIITRAEAAVMINNILHIPVISSEMAKPVFKDAVYIPSWAEKDIAALNSCGIINGDTNGNFNPNDLLDKAQAVEMLSNMADYSKSQSNSGGLLAFLFGR